MPVATIRKDSLVLYKTRPALVRRAADKLEISLEDGKAVRVRPKDVTLLHPGPLESLAQLTSQAGEMRAAWELLAGSTTTLPELVELAYGEFTPLTAWAAWEWVDDGLYFRGDPDAIEARTPEEVAQEEATRAARAAEAQAWADFAARVASGRSVPEDRRYLQEVEELALGQRDKSRVLDDLGRTQTPENAHALLLELGYWDVAVDPYPARLSVAVTSSTAPLAPLVEEPRRDLTHLAALAIDDEDTRDPDDAISLEGSRLWVHVADVAALVPPDSPADQEARARGANLYLPEGTVTMLPVQVTEQLALGMDEISPALSIGLDVDTYGDVTGCDIVPSWVRVTRMSYQQAESALADQPFAQLHRLARQAEARRRDNGAVSIDLPEVKIRVTDGRVQIDPLPPLRSRNLVLEAMLMAGEAVARFAIQRDIALPFTVQDPPEAQEEPSTLSGHFARRRTLKRSQQSTAPSPHAGLGLDLYTRATSPLRRYLDLVVHQQLRAFLRGEDPLDTQAVVERVGAAEAVTGSARQAERLARQHWTLVYLLQHPGWRGAGVLVDKVGLRGTVLIPELGWETRLHLRDDLPLDSTLHLAVSEVNLPALDAYFRIEH